MGEAPMICPECEEVLKDGARFCSNCGLSFSSLKTPTEQAETHDLPESLPELDPLVGEVLDGKYELLARLGEGGMGAVYRARRVHIGDEVALKVLLRKFVADAGLVERFRREARAAAALRHPNVVAIYDFGEARDDGAPADAHRDRRSHGHTSLYVARTISRRTTRRALGRVLTRRDALRDARRLAALHRAEPRGRPRQAHHRGSAATSGRRARPARTRRRNHALLSQRPGRATDGRNRTLARTPRRRRGGSPPTRRRSAASEGRKASPAK